ncbi:uncharacterized protein LOC124172810 [Ischnura elegans]|uniref:uncharacterized protein LOC124172810 n=1 Tax=Ischnura elegans TaxID=197161 RepID=UPI001ED884B6|nr:uncharacterized protein LOC124172810 [Ischnura elegans]
MEGENSNNSSALVVDAEAPAKESEQPVNNGETEATGTDSKPSGQSPPSVGREKAALPKKVKAMRSMMEMAEQTDEEREWQKFSAAEMKVLVREVELRKEALFGDYKEGESPKYRWLIWQEVAEKVNEVNPAVHRNLEQVRIKWFDHKDPSNKWEKRIKKSNPGYKHSTGMFFKRRAVASEGGAENGESGGEGKTKDGDSGERIRKLPASQANVPESVRLKSILSTLHDDKATKAIKYLSHSSQRQGIAFMAMKDRKDVENRADGGTTTEGEGNEEDRSSGDGPKKTYSKGLKSDTSPKRALKWMLGTDGEVLKPKEMKVEMLGGVQKLEPKTLSEMVNLLTKMTAKPGEGTDKITLKTSESLSTENKSVGVKRPGEDGEVLEPKRVVFGGTNEELKALLKTIDPSKVKTVKMKHPKTGKEMLVTKILAPEALKAFAKQKKPAFRPIAPKVTADVGQGTGEASAGVTNGGSNDKSGESAAVEGKGLSLPQLVTEEEGTEKTAVGEVQMQQKLVGSAVLSNMTPQQPSESTEGEATSSKSESKAGIDQQSSSIEEDDGNAVDCDMQPDQDIVMADIHSYDGESSNDPAKLLLAIGDVTYGLASTSTDQGDKAEAGNASSADSSETLLSNLQNNLSMAMQTSLGKEAETKSDEPSGKEVAVSPSSVVRGEQGDLSAQMSQSANDLAQKILKAVGGSPEGKSPTGKKLTPIQPGDVRLLRVGGKTVKVLIVNNEDHIKGTKTSGAAPLQGLPVDGKASVVGQVATQGVPAIGAAPSVAPTSATHSIKPNVPQTLLPKPSVLQTVITTLPTKVVTQTVPIPASNIVVSPNMIPVAGNNILSVASPVVAPNVIPIVASNLMTISQPMSIVTAPAPISMSGQKAITGMPVIIESADGVPVKTAGNVTLVDAGGKNVLTTSTPRQAVAKMSLSKKLMAIKGLTPVPSPQPTGLVGTAIGNILTTSPNVRVVSVPQKILPKGAIIGGRKPNILSSQTKTASAAAASVPSFGVKRAAPTVVKAGVSKLKVRVVTDKGDGKELEKKQHPLVKAALSGKPIDFQEELKKLDPEERVGGTVEGSKGQGTPSGGTTSSTTGHAAGKDEDIQVITLSPPTFGSSQRPRMVAPSTVSQLRVKQAESLQSIRIASPGTLNKKISLSHIAVLNSSTQGQRASPVKGKRKQELTVKSLDNVGAKRSFEESIDADDCVIVDEIGTRMSDPPEVFCVDSNDSYGVEVS